MKYHEYDIKDFNMIYFDEYLALLNKVIEEGKWLARYEPFEYESSLEYIKNKHASRVPFILVFDRDRLIGWCDADSSREGVGYLAIGLHEDYRGKGIGKILIKEIIKKSIEFGFNKINLSVRATNHRAIALYKRIGFRQIEFITDGLILPNEKIDVVGMTLDL